MNSAARTVAPASDTDTSFRPFEAGERGPGLTPSSPQDVRSGERLENPGPRVRYVMERGSGSAGTAYNKLDFEVLDRHAMPGRQLVCRTSQAFARLITYALNRVIPT